MATTLNLKSVNGEVIKIKVKQDPASIITGQTAVVGAINLSSEGLFVQNDNGILEFKGLQAGSGISLTPNSTGITITASVTGITGYVTNSTFTGYTASTETRLDGIEDDIVYLSGQTTNKLNTSVFNGYTASTSSVLTGLDNDINYLSGQTAAKVNTSVFNAYTASTDVVIDNALTGVTAGANLAVNNSNPRKPHITFTGSTGVGDVTHAQLDPWTGATNTRLNDIESDIVYLSGQTNTKLNITTFNSYTGATDPILDGAITGVTAGANLSAVQTGRVVNITYTGTTGGGAGVTLEYKYDSTITAGSPAAKFFRLNNADAASATEVRFAYSTNNSVDASTVLLAAKAGAKLYLQLLSNGDEAVLYNITANPVDNGTYVTYTVTLASAGVDTTFTNNAAFGIILNPTGSYVSQSSFNTYTGATETRLDGIEADIVYLSGQTSSKVNTSLFNTYTGATATALSNINSELDLALTGATNLGTGQGILSTSGRNVTGKSLKVGTNLGISSTANDVTITFTGSTGGGSGTITGATNLGGVGLYTSPAAANLQFKGLVAGSNITLTPSSTGVTIAASGGGGGGAYLPLSGGTVTGDTNFSSGVNVYGDIVTLTGNTTLTASHAGLTIECNGTFTVTLPNSMVTGMKVTLINVGTGIITIAASTTLQTKNSNTKLASRYGGASAYHRGSNIWIAVGDLTS